MHGSLIRCSIAMLDAASGKWLKAGSVVKAAATNPQAQEYIAACTGMFLADLPHRTKLVIMLSNDDNYIEACYSVFKDLYPNIMRHSQVCYGNDEHTWVHVIHPSGSSGRHIPDWLNKSVGRQAQKRDAALVGVHRSGVMNDLHL